MSDMEFKKCRLEDVKFEALNEEERRIVADIRKWRPWQTVFTVFIAVAALGLLVWAWILSHNGIAYSICFTVLSLFILFGGWLFAGRNRVVMESAAHGVLKNAYFDDTSMEQVDTVLYYATIDFPSSGQEVAGVNIPLTYTRRLPEDGTEVILFKTRRRSIVVRYIDSQIGTTIEIKDAW